MKAVSNRTPGRRHLLPLRLVAVGLFGVSWDRVLVVSVGDYQLKFAMVAFALAIGLLLLEGRPIRLTSLGRWILLVGIAAAVPLGWAVDPRALLAGLAAIALSSGAPVLAILNSARTADDFAYLLTWFIRGGVVAAAFGLYQLFAFYAQLPQVVDYSDLGGGLARISSFSYEAGYFGYYMILVIAACLSRAKLRGEQVQVGLVLFLAVVLLLANSRATFITVPVLLALIFARKLDRREIGRLIATSLAAGAAAVGGILAFPYFFSNLVARALSILDPTEESSNAPRLAALRVAARIAEDQPMGLGLKNYIYAARPYGLRPATAGSEELVVNNIWYQARIDGGWLLLAVELAVVGWLIVCCYRRRALPARLLFSGYLSVLVVGGLVTSYYFDIKLWAVAGLAVGLASLEDETKAGGSEGSVAAVSSGADVRRRPQGRLSPKGTINEGARGQKDAG